MSTQYFLLVVPIICFANWAIEQVFSTVKYSIKYQIFATFSMEIHSRVMSFSEYCVKIEELY